MKATLRKPLSILLALLMIFTLAELPALSPFNVKASAALSGAGTSAKPYLIATADDLAAFKNLVDSNAGACAKLTADIDLTGKSWGYGIASSGTGYTGTFDGNYHTVKNFGGVETALFRFIGTGGTVKNVIVICTAADSICYRNYGTIENCVNNSTSTAISSGICNENASGATIKNCVNYAPVANAGICMNNSGTITGCANLGNPSGNSCAGICTNNNGTGIIEKCYNAGNMTTNGAQRGGICCTNEGIIRYCYNTGNISGLGNIGGIAYFSSKTIINCYNKGTITGTGQYIGGIVGQVRGGQIGGCYNYGTVDASDSTSGSICGESQLQDTSSDTQTARNYYLDGTHTNGVGVDPHTKLLIESRTAAQFKNLATNDILSGNGDGYTDDPDGLGRPYLTDNKEHATHTYGNAVEITAATCGADGVQKKSCTVTGCPVYTIETVAATGSHNFSPTAASGGIYRATDNGDGTHSKTCSVCGTVVTEEHVVTLDWQGINDPITYDSDPTIHHKPCDLCGASAETAPHDEIVWRHYDGDMHWRECVTCGASFDVDYHDAATLEVIDGEYFCKVCKAPTTYTVTVTGGTASKTAAAKGDTVTVTATVPSGKKFGSWTVVSGGITLANTATATFTMPAANVEVTATFVDDTTTGGNEGGTTGGNEGGTPGGSTGGPSGGYSPSQPGAMTGSAYENSNNSNTGSTGSTGNTGSTGSTGNTTEQKPAVEVTKQSADSASIEWQPKTGVSGYIVEKQNEDGSWTTVKTIKGSKNTELDLSDLEAGTTTNVRVRSYTVKSNGKKSVSSASTAQTVSITTAPEKATNVKAANVTKNSAVIKLKMPANADGVQILKKVNGKWKVDKTINGANRKSVKITGLKAGAKNKIAVRAYVKDASGKKVFGKITKTTVKTAKK